MTTLLTKIEPLHNRNSLIQHKPPHRESRNPPTNCGTWGRCASAVGAWMRESGRSQQPRSILSTATTHPPLLVGRTRGLGCLRRRDRTRLRAVATRRPCRLHRGHDKAPGDPVHPTQSAVRQDRHSPPVRVDPAAASCRLTEPRGITTAITQTGDARCKCRPVASLHLISDKAQPWQFPVARKDESAHGLQCVIGRRSRGSIALR